MSRMGYIVRRIVGMDYKNMLKTVGNVHRISGKNRVGLFFDVAKCGLKYGAGYKDYELFEFYNMNPAQRATYVTRTVNNSVVARCNNRDYYHCFNDKTEFNTLFKDFIHRDWLDFRKASKEEFQKFMEGKTAIIAKPIDATCGAGVQKIVAADYPSIDALYDYLKGQEGAELLEDYIIQHPDVSALYPYSVNTMRIMTLLWKGVPHIIYACIRMGNEGRVVDNINSGGMTSPVDIETGVIQFPGYDKAGNLYEKHPMTGHTIAGTQIPFWKESVEMCKKAALVVPQVGYCGWDVAITPNGPLLIEANHMPGNDAYQLPPHTPGYIGMLPKYKAIIPDL